MSVLPCAKAGCEEKATHVVAETHQLNCLFESGAGLTCEHHSEELCKIGGIRLPFDAFVAAIRKEQE